MATKTAVKGETFNITASVTVESTIAISATGFVDAAEKANQLTHEDFVTAVGELYDFNGPVISSIYR